MRPVCCKETIRIAALVFLVLATAACTQSPVKSHSTTRNLGMDPGCLGANVTLMQPDGSPEDSEILPDISGSVGQQLTLTAKIDADPSIFMDQAQMVVEVPGASIGNPSASGPGYAEQSQNQVATSVPVSDEVANGQTLTIVWTPEATGTYPVVYDLQFAQSDDCTSAPPATPLPNQQFGAEGDLATITVQ